MLTFNDPREGRTTSQAVMDDAGGRPHPENFISWEL